MITTLGYEEIRRLHDERVARSIRAQGVQRAMREVHVPNPGPDAEIIEVEFNSGCSDQERLGA